MGFLVLPRGQTYHSRIPQVLKSAQIVETHPKTIDVGSQVWLCNNRAEQAASVQLSEAGAAALREWATDIDRAIGPGIDPFRVRSSEWASLPTREQEVLRARLETALRTRADSLAGDLQTADTADPRLELDLALQMSRLGWLRDQAAQSDDE